MAEHADKYRFYRLILDFRRRSNQITNLPELVDLTQLQTLLLNNNQIHSLAALASLSQLKFLSIALNQITNLEPLGGLWGLNMLVLGGNPIADLQSIGGLSQLMLLDMSVGEIDRLDAWTGLWQIISFARLLQTAPESLRFPIYFGKFLMFQSWLIHWAFEWMGPGLAKEVSRSFVQFMEYLVNHR